VKGGKGKKKRGAAERGKKEKEKKKSKSFLAVFLFARTAARLLCPPPLPLSLPSRFSAPLPVCMYQE
jgi:hypothetical protein